MEDTNMEDAPPSAQVEDVNDEDVEEEEEEEEEEIEPQRVKIVSSGYTNPVQGRCTTNQTRSFPAQQILLPRLSSSTRVTLSETP